jgi:hypothetical protein
MAYNGITFVPNFVNTYQVLDNLRWDTTEHLADLINLYFFVN